MTIPRKLRVQNTDLIRDVHSKAVLATDLSAYELHKKKKARELYILSIERKVDRILLELNKGDDDVQA